MDLLNTEILENDLHTIIIYIIFLYIIIVTITYIIQYFIAAVAVRKYLKKLKSSSHSEYAKSQNIIPISIAVPAYGEEEIIISAINALLNLDYQTYEVVVVNDGSTDNTLQILIDEFNLKPVLLANRDLIKTEKVLGIYKNLDIPKLVLIDKENGGKADSTNAAINASKYPYVTVIDADTLLEKDSLARLAMPFIENKDTVAVGGSIRVLNGAKVKNGEIIEANMPKSHLAGFQVLEYYRAYLLGRMVWDTMGSTLIISGAFGLFKKDVIVEIGGYTNEGVAEDMELIVRMHRKLREEKRNYRITYINDAVCWTQAPDNIIDLWNQRRRWHIGLMDTLFKNKQMLFNPKYGVHGMFTVPYFWLFEFLSSILLPLGYILVFLGYFTGTLDFQLFMCFVIFNILLGIALSLGAILLEQYAFGRYLKISQMLKISMYAILENFGYRQIMLLARIDAMVRYKKYKNSWHKNERKSVE